MLEDELTQTLARPTTPGIDREIQRLAQVAEGTARPRRLNRRGAIALIISGALALGGATAATAGPAVWKWAGFTSDRNATVTLPSGQGCAVAFKIAPYWHDHNDPAPAVAAAKDYLEKLDLSSVDISKALAESMTDGTSTETTFTPQQEAAAFGSTVAMMVIDEQTRDGYLDATGRGSATIQWATKCD